MRHVTTIIAIVAVALAASSAYASTSQQTPQTFGAPGTSPDLSANCRRMPMDLTPAGKTVKSLKRFVFQVTSVQDAEHKCDNRRINRLVHCAARALPTGDPQVVLFRKDDWQHVDGFQAYVDGYNAAVTRVFSCMSNVIGTKRG